MGNPVSSTNKTDRYDITEILLKVALSTITLIPNLEWILLISYLGLFEIARITLFDLQCIDILSLFFF